MVLTENLIGEKEKWTHRGKDRQKEADTLSNKTKCHIRHLYQIPKS